MTFFIQNGDVFSPTPGRDSMLTELPVGNYIVIQTLSGLKFQRVDSFDDPGRVYGNVNQRAERILRTFLDRPRTTGVLLSGEKGSGKSQLARVVSRLGYDAGIPTILVNAPFCGDQFNALLASIEQPAIVLMDEFEKVYHENEAQEAVLTLLDGMMTSQKLFILTVNDKYRVNEHMKNRPGRIFYAVEFGGLESEFVREYCQDNLDDKEQIDSVLKIAAMFKAFNFDMLKALVEEMNRYKETAFEAIDLLNAKPISDSDSTKYEVVVISPGGIESRPVELGDIPLAGGQGRSNVGFYAEFTKPVEKGHVESWMKDLGLDQEDVDDGDTNRHIVLSVKDLKQVDVENGRYKYVTDDGWTAHFTKKKPVNLSYYDY